MATKTQERIYLSVVVIAVIGAAAIVFYARTRPPAAEVSPKVSVETQVPPIDFDNADRRVLFIGNSHVSTHGMTAMFQELAQSDDAETRWYVATATGGFLSEHLHSPTTLEKLDRKGWDVVVLQAQKYSMSGQYAYSTEAAEELTRIANENGARVVMYPEWRQKGNPDEGKRVHALHVSIVEKTGAEIAPVGLAWDEALAQDSDLPLHDFDGNHASAKGAYLTACVFYATILGKSPVGCPVMERCELSAEQAEMLQQAAWKVVAQYRQRQTNDDAQI